MLCKRQQSGEFDSEMASRFQSQQHDQSSQPEKIAKRSGRRKSGGDGGRSAADEKVLRQKTGKATDVAAARKQASDESGPRGAVPRESLPAPAGSKWQRYWYLPVFAAYVLLVGVTVAHHEPWFDEAQAWLIARDATWSDLLFTLPRYEGSPMLWHTLLALPARSGLPFACESVIAATFAAGGVLMLLARSPLPKYLAAMAPFTFFLVYQYAVVAHSYVLMPLLLFLCADLYPSRFRRPLWYAAPLCLLAHLSAHGLFLAAALMGLLGLEVISGWYRDRDMAVLKRVAVALGVFGLVAAAAAWQVRPPTDHYGGMGYQVALWPRIPFVMERWSGAFTDAYIPSLLVLLVSLAWFWRTRVLTLYLLLTGAVLALFLIAACWYHHEGILFLVWLFALWISFQQAQSMGILESQRTVRLRWGFSALVAIVFAQHIYWSFASIREDLRYDYSGAKAVAEYLKREGLESKRIVTSDMYALAAAPYFDKNIFTNFHNGRGTSFVVFADKYFHSSGVFRFPLPYREPFDVLVLGVKHPPFSRLPWDDPDFELPLSSDYRCVGYFPGHLFWKTAAYERDDYVCYVRKDLPAARHELSSGAAARLELPVRNLERIPQPADGVDNPVAGAHTVFARMLQVLDPPAATEHFRAAVQIQPVSLTHSNLGGILARTNPAEAVQHLKAALELDPGNAAAYANLGNISARAGRYDTAIECYRRALSIEPGLAGVGDSLRAATRLKMLPDDRPRRGAGEPDKIP